MSGKAPPRGPRALLSSLPTPSSTSQASTSTPSTSTSPGSSSSKIGVHPPTGPRSLVNGVSGQPRIKPLVNGYPPTSPSVIHTPLAPRSSQKGKQVELGWSTSDVSFLFLRPHWVDVELAIRFRAPCSLDWRLRALRSLWYRRRPRN